jgi:hypothetical protein
MCTRNERRLVVEAEDALERAARLRGTRFRGEVLLPHDSA